MKPLDYDGREIDASYSVNPTIEGFDIKIESRSGAARGSTRTRNSEYTYGLEIILARLAHYGAVLERIYLDSEEARKLPENERILTIPGFDTPLTLTSAVDVHELRLEIGRQSSDLASKSQPGQGNRNKSLLLRFSNPMGATSIPAAEIIRGSLAMAVIEIERYEYANAKVALRRIRKEKQQPEYVGSPDLPSGRTVQAFLPMLA